MYKYPANSGTGAPQGGQSSQAQSSAGQSQPAAGARAADGSGAAGAPEQVMEGLNYTFGSPLYRINNMTFNTADESVVMAVYENDNITGESKGRLLRYEWDDNAIASSDEKIRVYSLYDNYSVRLALSEFKRLHPEVFVEYEVAFGTEDNGGGITPLMRAAGDYSASMGGSGTGMTEEDALRALNTELLNGTGPDVIVLDGLPVESFITKGVLIDLASIINGNDDLFPSIFEPMKRDGKIYAVPTNFFVPTLFGEKGYVEQFSDLQALVAAIEAGADLPTAVEPQDDWTDEDWNNYWNTMNSPKPAEEQPVMYFESLDDLTATLYATCAPAIFSEKGGIDQANLRTFLEAVKKISDKYGLANPDNMSYGGVAYMSSYGGGYYNYNYSATLSRYGQRQGRLGYSRLGSTNTLSDVSSSLYYSAQNNSWGKEIIEYDDEGNPIEPTEPVQEPETLPAANPTTISAPGLSSGAYFPTQMVGVTSTSKKQELAKQFISTMLSGDVQKNDMGNGFPVSRAAFKTMYEGYLKQGERYKHNGEGPDMMAFDYEALVGTLTTPFYVNDYVRSAITSPIADYCAGNTNLDDVVKKIVDETELYFAERQ